MTTPPLQPVWTIQLGVMDLDFAATSVMMRQSDEDHSPWKWVESRSYEDRTETLPPAALDGPERTICIQCVVITFVDGSERVFDFSDEVEIGLPNPPGRSIGKNRQLDTPQSLPV
jgi:hypothetical protein